MTAAFFLVSSALLHALWNVAAKKGDQPTLRLAAILTSAAFFSLFFIPLFQEPAVFSIQSLAWGLGAGICEGGYIISLMLTLECAPVGAAYTLMRGGAMIVVWMTSVFLLGEPFHLNTVGGVAVVLVGLYLTGVPLQPRLQPEGKTDFKWAYVCAAFIAGYHLCYDRALAAHANPGLLFSFSLWIAMPLMFLYLGRRRLLTLRHRLITQGFPLLLGGLICATSFLLFLIGLRHSGAGYALTLRNLSVVFAQLFAVAIGERVTRAQWAGAILVALGAALVSV